MNEESLPDEFLREAAEVIKLLGHPQRLRILEFLDIYGESPVSVIVENIGASQGAVSQQLNRMRRAGLISCRRQGRQVMYKVFDANPVAILNCLRKQYKNQKSEI